MEEQHIDFLNEVIETRDRTIEIPKVINSEIVERITTSELAQLLMDFSFSGGLIDLDNDASVFTVDIGYANAIFFSNRDWNAKNASDFFGVIATVPSSFDTNFIALFNQNTKIGRLYNAEGTDAAIYRLDVHLAGGVTHRNIFYVVKTFIDIYNKLFFEISEGTEQHVKKS
ncbi:hypothetical protein [Shewanella sp. UCD-KL12]|uniref:hypothetical protein n=1 Tax=Shewanella sp. UCD-KL12 TaxID=1917163 RepID=UPI000970E336|nr:hypothetical protein [Shewanella sp. UCD-KL12]